MDVLQIKAQYWYLVNSSQFLEELFGLWRSCCNVISKAIRSLQIVPQENFIGRKKYCRFEIINICNTLTINFIELVSLYPNLTFFYTQYRFFSHKKYSPDQENYIKAMDMVLQRLEIFKSWVQCLSGFRFSICVYPCNCIDWRAKSGNTFGHVLQVFPRNWSNLFYKGR